MNICKLQLFFMMMIPLSNSSCAASQREWVGREVLFSKDSCKIDKEMFAEGSDVLSRVEVECVGTGQLLFAAWTDYAYTFEYQDAREGTIVNMTYCVYGLPTSWGGDTTTVSELRKNVERANSLLTSNGSPFSIHIESAKSSCKWKL